MLLPPALHLLVLAGEVAVARLPAGAPVPTPPADAALFAVTVTPEETSVVCPVEAVPDGARAERGWRVLKIEGPLDLDSVGVLASLLNPLVSARVSIFVVSTFDTDYVLVKDDALRQAATALRVAGHRVDLDRPTRPVGS